MGDKLERTCIKFGIIKTGTQTPPIAANTTTNVAPKGAACSCEFAIVPNNNPKPTAANPAKNEITIETSLTDNNNIKILDVTGKLISDNNFNTNKITLSVSDFDNGIYFYNIYDVDGNVLHSNKFVIAK